MPVRIAVYPDQRTHLQTLLLEGVQVQLRLQWVARTRGWYLDLSALDGTPLLKGQRLSPGSPPLLGYQLGPLAPPGTFFVRGPSDYFRTDLGARLVLLYYASDEVPEPSSVDDGIAVALA